MDVGAYDRTRNTAWSAQLEGVGFTITELLGYGAAASEHPDAIHVEQGPGVLGAHFHLADQFQVFLAGGGAIGRHPLAPLTVHYASQHTGYGPVVAGADGLTYLTLRPITRRETLYLPGAASQRDHSQRPRQVSVGPIEPLAPGDDVAVRELIAPAPDGLAAWQVSLAPGASRPAPSGDGGGRYQVVTDGMLQADGRGLASRSVVWTAADEPPLQLSAGPAGASVLVLQFPRRA